MDDNNPPDHLPSIHRVILTGAKQYPGRFTRSELAKLLAGSVSGRFSDYNRLPEFGRLAGHSRKNITFEIDILLQQKYLAFDERQKVIPGSISHSLA